MRRTRRHDDPQDLLIAFSDGNDADGNGFVDDIAGWDFLDNDNDAYDDVQYGHGTGEAQDSIAEANNGGDAGSCPNCMFIPMRVGDSFVADANIFAQAVDLRRRQRRARDPGGARHAQQHRARAAGGRLRVRARRGRHRVGGRRGRPAPQLAVELRAHDRRELGHKYDTFTPARSYVQFNGCTNFSTQVTLAIPSYELLLERDRGRVRASPASSTAPPSTRTTAATWGPTRTASCVERRTRAC